MEFTSSSGRSLNGTKGFVVDDSGADSKVAAFIDGACSRSRIDISLHHALNDDSVSPFLMQNARLLKPLFFQSLICFRQKASLRSSRTQRCFDASLRI
jgi:hypothetical protein